MQDFIVASVGGQGGLLATTLLAEVFVKAGFDVKTSEVHGMAQRGGSVVSYVRRGKKVFSPVVLEGSADVLLGLEILEAYRQLPNLKKGGLVVTGSERIAPVPVIMGQAEYPEITRESFLTRAGSVYVVPALEIAKTAGNVRTSNTACLGALSVFLDVPEDVWKDEIAARVPKRTVDANIIAFTVGREWMEKNR